MAVSYQLIPIFAHFNKIVAFGCFLMADGQQLIAFT